MSRTQLRALSRYGLSVLMAAYALPMQAATSPQGVALPTTVMPEAFKQAAQAYINTQDLSGMTLIYLEKGHTPAIFSLGYTSLDPQNRFAISPASRFEIGSLTKLFTGLLVADCVAQQACRPQDTFKQHLPSFALSEDLAQVSLQQVLTHTSGLPPLPHNLSPANPRDPYADYSDAQLKAYLSQATVSNVGQYRYSNIGFGLLGYRFAQNKALQQVFEQKILQPLHMGRTSVEDLENRAITSIPHTEGEASNPWHFQDSTAGAGALRSSGEDMAKFLYAQMFPQYISSPELKQAVIESHNILVSQSQLKQPMDMAYAWHKIKVKNTSLYTHSGQTGGFTSFIGFDENRERGAVILSNGIAELGSLGLAMIVPEIPARGPKDLRLPAETLAPYTGKYELAPDAIFTITQRNGYLYAQLTGQDAHRVYPVAGKPHHFRYTIVDAMLAFDENGQGLVLHQNGEQKAPRIR